MADRGEVRVLLVGDDSGVVEDFRHLFASQRPSGSARSIGKLESELFGAAVHHEDFPDIDLMVCRQGGEGVQAVRGALAEERPFAATFIDMQLAPGLDWVQTAEQVRAWDPAAQIVMLAGHSDVHPMDICARIPPADKLFFVQKPFHALQVKQLVCALAARRRAGADGPRESTRGITISPAAPTDCAWAASAVAEAELIAPVPTTTGIPAAVSRATPSIRSASLTSGQSPIDPQ